MLRWRMWTREVVDVDVSVVCPCLPLLLFLFLLSALASSRWSSGPPHPHSPFPSPLLVISRLIPAPPPPPAVAPLRRHPFFPPNQHAVTARVPPPILLRKDHRTRQNPPAMPEDPARYQRRDMLALLLLRVVGIVVGILIRELKGEQALRGEQSSRKSLNAKERDYVMCFEPHIYKRHVDGTAAGQLWERKRVGRRNVLTYASTDHGQKTIFYRPCRPG